MRQYIITLAALMVLATVAEAQPDYRLLKVDMSLGAAIPAGEGSKGGFLFALEPKLNIHHSIAIGFKTEFAGMARAAVYNSQVFRGDLSYNMVLQPTAELYIGHRSGLRPFVGVGFGYYHIAEARNVTVAPGSNGPDKEDFREKKLAGIMCRAGIESWHLRLAVEYNAMPNSGSVINNYLGIKAGFFIGGGKR